MQIKRIITVGLALILALSAAGCGSADTKDNTSAQTEQVQKADQAVKTESDEGQNESTSQTAEETQVSNKENDTLIVYFSAANMNDVDAVTSATPLIDGESSVEWIANIIQEKTGADIARIIPAEDYPLSYDDVADAAKKEADNEVHPVIRSLDVDPTSYKTVFIGYPMWWYRMPMVLETFFDTYDFSGVTIIPFNTHEGSRDGGTYDMIRDREPDATVLGGIAIRGGNAGEDSAKDDIEEWLDGLPLE